MKKVVIKASSLPPRLPVTFGAVVWLLLDRFDAPEWAFGAFWALAALLAAGFFYGLHNSELKDVPGFGERKS